MYSVDISGGVSPARVWISYLLGHRVPHVQVVAYGVLVNGMLYSDVVSSVWCE